MRDLIRIGLSVLTVLATSNSLVLGDGPTDPICGLASSGIAQTGPFLPTTGTNKALIIYAHFSDDTFSSGTGGGAECTQDSVTEWPYNRSDIPSWGLKIDLDITQLVDLWVNGGATNQGVRLVSHRKIVEKSLLTDKVALAPNFKAPAVRVFYTERP